MAQNEEIYFSGLKLFVFGKFYLSNHAGLVSKEEVYYKNFLTKIIFPKSKLITPLFLESSFAKPKKNHVGLSAFFGIARGYFSFKKSLRIISAVLLIHELQKIYTNQYNLNR
ncbi:hypothetical protein [Aquiflexum balticum]|nr:hypothetical protein [Aquiflexum balticum]